VRTSDIRKFLKKRNAFLIVLEARNSKVEDAASVEKLLAVSSYDRRQKDKRLYEKEKKRRKISSLDQDPGL
jgi:predicted GIY-YIG superfamily endonuclease